MLKLLLKKQIAEVFRSYFYDAKKNKMRSKWAVAGWIVFFIVIMVGVLGGMFTALSLSLCSPLTQAGAGWLYFVLMGGISILLGAFGSVFNTYSGLYLAKDNDLLFSLPIPARTILVARLLNVYLMGAMYAATALIPALIVYWIVAGVTAARVICGLLLMLIVTAFVMQLSCVLGWAVAKISLRLKNKSVFSVLLSLLFIGAYYFFYFKANDLVRNLIQNVDIYGEKIKGAAYGLYLFGRVGEGDWMAALLFCVVTALLSALIWIVLSRTFLQIATASGKTEKVRYVEKPVRTKSVFGALLAKEFARLSSSANYMLNSALGVLLIPVVGVLLLLKGREIFPVLDRVFAGRPDTAAVLLVVGLCAAASMIDVAVPSVSLEGKSLWIPKSLPVHPRTVLRAKTTTQLILTALPMLFASLCAALVLQSSPLVRLLLVIMPQAYTAFYAVFSTVIGLRMPLLNWTDEIAPIKQSGAVAIVIFGGWGFTVLLAGLYLLIGYRIGAALYMTGWSVLLAAAALLLLRWLDTRGVDAFKAL